MLELGNVKLFLLHAIKLLPLIITINLGVELDLDLERVRRRNNYINNSYFSRFRFLDRQFLFFDCLILYRLI
jgi:hypothetical protein